MAQAPYGSCPDCGRLGVDLDNQGIVTCPNGHRYPHPAMQAQREAAMANAPKEVRDAQVQPTPGWGNFPGMAKPVGEAPSVPVEESSSPTPDGGFPDVVKVLQRTMAEHEDLKRRFEAIRLGLQATLQEVETILLAFESEETPVPEGAQFDPEKWGDLPEEGEGFGSLPEIALLSEESDTLGGSPLEDGEPEDGHIGGPSKTPQAPEEVEEKDSPQSPEPTGESD